MPGDYFDVVLKVKTWLERNPGVTRTQLLRWIMVTFKFKSRKASKYIDLMVEDDFIRAVVNVEDKNKKRGKGRLKTRYIATQS